MTTLSERSFRVFRELARTLFDDGQGVVEARLDFMIAELRAMFAATGAASRMAMGLALVVIQWFPLFLIGRPRRFTSLSPALRRRYLERLEKSVLSILYMGLKTFACMTYYEHPDAAAITGFDPALGPAPQAEVAAGVQARAQGGGR